VSPGYLFALVAIVLGLVLGAGAVGLTWFVTTRPVHETQSSGDDAQFDGWAACTALNRVPDLGLSASSATAQNSVFLQLSGAAALAQAASAMNSHYQKLSDALRNAEEVIVASYGSDPLRAGSALANARVACASL
jgi:hypothetical protein